MKYKKTNVLNGLIYPTDFQPTHIFQIEPHQEPTKYLLFMFYQTDFLLSLSSERKENQQWYIIHSEMLKEAELGGLSHNYLELN